MSADRLCLEFGKEKSESLAGKLQKHSTAPYGILIPIGLSDKEIETKVTELVKTGITN